MSSTTYMVIERFKGGHAEPVYRRFREHGRLVPEGLTYVESWVDETLRLCFQVMRTDRRALLDAWIARWSDLVDFEVYPVVSSAEAASRVLGEENAPPLASLVGSEPGARVPRRRRGRRA